jgi:hypothetical protein
MRAVRKGDIVAVIGPNCDFASAVEKLAGHLGEVVGIDLSMTRYPYDVKCLRGRGPMPLDRNEFILVGTL